MKSTRAIRSTVPILVALSAAGSAAAAGEPFEWTLEAARRCWRPMVRPVQHVGVPGHQFQAGVMWDGAVVIGPIFARDNPALAAELAPLGDNRLHISVGFGDPMRLVDRRGTGSPAIVRSLEEGRLPIPRVVTFEGGLRWEETVFAHLLDRPFEGGLDPRPGDLLVVEAIFLVRNPGPGGRTGKLRIHLGDASSVEFGYKCRQKDDLSPAVPHRLDGSIGLAGDGRVRYAIPGPAKGSVRIIEEAGLAPAAPGGPPRTAKDVIAWDVPLGAGEEATLRLALPYGPVDREAGLRISALDAAPLFEETRLAWRRIVDGPGRIVTPDPFVNDYLAAVPAQMAQQVAFRAKSDLWMYKTSPNHYEVYWPCNAAKALPALDLRGLGALDRKVLGGFVGRQSDDFGRLDRASMGHGEKVAGEGFARIPGFLGNFGEWTANTLLLSHGLEMWALAGHFRTTRDDRWLGSGPGSPLEGVLAAFDWIAVQRKRTMRKEDGKKVPNWGLLPAASAHDWLAGSTIFNDAFCAYGMAEVVRLLREIGHPRSGEMARELAGYRAAIGDRYREARDRARPVPLPDGTSLPYVPRMIGEDDWRTLDWTYTGYGPLRAGAWGAVDPFDPIVTQSLAFLDAGMPRGEGAYFSAHLTALREAGGGRPAADANWAPISDPEAERHFMWRHSVEYETMWPVGGPLFLARDDLPRFFEWLFHNLAVAVHEEWRVGVESLDGVPSCAPGDGERWQTIRAMLVNERGGWDGGPQSLWLLQAVPRSWLRPGDRISVGEMGTRFGGTIDLDVEVAPDRSALVRLEWRGFAVLPEKVVLRLRSGDGKPLRSAEVDGKTVPVRAGDLIELPPEGAARHRVVGRWD